MSYNISNYDITVHKFNDYIYILVIYNFITYERKITNRDINTSIDKFHVFITKCLEQKDDYNIVITNKEKQLTITFYTDLDEYKMSKIIKLNKKELSNNELLIIEINKLKLEIKKIKETNNNESLLLEIIKLRKENEELKSRFETKAYICGKFQSVYINELDLTGYEFSCDGCSKIINNIDSIVIGSDFIIKLYSNNNNDGVYNKLMDLRIILNIKILFKNNLIKKITINNNSIDYKPFSLQKILYFYELLLKNNYVTFVLNNLNISNYNYVCIDYNEYKNIKLIFNNCSFVKNDNTEIITSILNKNFKNRFMIY